MIIYKTINNKHNENEKEQKAGETIQASQGTEQVSGRTLRILFGNSCIPKGSAKG